MENDYCVNRGGHVNDREGVYRSWAGGQVSVIRNEYNIVMREKNRKSLRERQE